LDEPGLKGAHAARLVLRTLAVAWSAWVCSVDSMAATQSGSDQCPALAPVASYYEQGRLLTDRVRIFAQRGPFHVTPLGNVTIVEQERGYVLIDAGGSMRSGRDLVTYLRSLGPKPVTAIVITHTHWDHWLGLRALIDAWPAARVIATRNTRDHLAIRAMTGIPTVSQPAREVVLQAQIRESVRELEQMRDTAGAADPLRQLVNTAIAETRQFGCDIRGAVTVMPTEAFDEHLLLDDPAAPVELRFVGRANTDGDAIAWLPRQRIIAAGDIVVAPVPFGAGPVFPADWVEALRRLRALGATSIVPGHGPVLAGQAYLDRLIAALEDARGQAAALARLDMPAERILAAMNFDRQASLFTGDDPWLRRWFMNYWARGIAARAYREARGIPLM
jgi:glyoxylase-like metal-dependent hydrolase (beta-lactamase superfamily II)